jgi:glucose-6-phosphate 1-dehydrogenase
MLKRGNINLPVIGVAEAGWNLDQLKARAKDSLEKHDGLDPAAFANLSGLLRSHWRKSSCARHRRQT